MQPVSDNVRAALLKVLRDVLIYARAWAASKTGITPEQASVLNQLFNLTHNVPGFIDGSYALGFDEAWFTAALRQFDEKNRTHFAATYVATRESADVSSGAHFRAIADFTDLLVPTHAQLLEHHYDDAAFGSWWISLRRRRVDFRVVFDGRDSVYRLERAVPANPSGLETVWEAPGGRHAVPQELIDALRRT